jgi:exosortase O
MSAQHPPRRWRDLVQTLAPPVNWPQVALNAAVAGMWLWLFRSTFGYLSVIFAREDFRTNQIVLLGALALVAVRLRREGMRGRLDAAPHLHVPALALATAGAAGYLAAERLLDVNIVSACLFGLASYGLLGLWMRPAVWRAGLPAALLLIGALPFGDFVDVFIGYPARIATAAVVRDGLAAAGVTSVGVDTILVFENSVSQVDLPCSGVKSLWTGALFLIAATWIERRTVSVRWFGIALLFALVLFVANTARVAALVVVGDVFGLRLLAEMLHVPLGMLAFITACAAGVVLLRLLPAESATSATVARESPRPKWLVAGLLAGVLALNVLHAPKPIEPLTKVSTPAVTLPSEFNAQLMPLQPGELSWLLEDGAERVDRVRFDWRGLTGSLLVVTSTHWRAHHQPERCFENDGLRAQSSATHLVQGGMPVRVLSLAGHEDQLTLSAAYWFQSPTRSTDDYTARLWSALTPRPERWVMVSVLFDRAIDPRAADADALYVAFHRAAQEHLKQ